MGYPFIDALRWSEVLADVWSSLQASNQAGYHKRPATDSPTHPYASKKRKECRQSTGSNCIAMGPAPIASDLLPLPCTSVQNSTPLEGSVPTKNRRIAKAKRPRLIAPSKVRDWLLSSDSSGTLPSKAQETIPSFSASDPTSSLTKKKRNPRRKQAQAQVDKIVGVIPLSPEIPATPPVARRRSKKTTHI